MPTRYLLPALMASALAESPALAEPDSAEVEADAPPPTGSFQIGAGFSTDDGFIASAAIHQPNLFGRGQDLSLTTRLSERRQLYLLHFGEPHLLDSDTSLSVDLYDLSQTWPGFTREATGGALTLGRALGAHLDGFVSYRLEQIAVDPAEPAVTARVVEPGGWDPSLMMRGGRLSSLRTGVVYDTLDQPLFPRRGTVAGAWVERADRQLGSEIDLTRGAAFASHHLPLGPFTLHLGGAVEAVTSRDPRGVPLSERLQLDGASELRGFAPGSLGPSQGGIALGGLSGSLFFDAGGVMDLEGRSGNAFGQSVGVGLTWKSPIGPVQIGVAYPLDGDGVPRIVFGIGMTF